MAADLKSAYVLHHLELTRYLRRRMSDQHAATDLVHDAFVRMAEQPLAKIQDARSYLFRIAGNLLRDQIRQDRRRQTFAVAHETIAHIAEDRPSPEDAADARLRLERLQRIVGELPFKTQQIFMLNRVDGLTYVEVARHLGISDSSVQKHLALAVRHITRNLTRR